MAPDELVGASHRQEPAYRLPVTRGTGACATDCLMTIEAWWSQLRPETRQWLIANNGDAVPPLIVDEIAAVGGPSATHAWWRDPDGSPGRCLPDEAVDWIEAAANDEVEGA